MRFLFTVATLVLVVSAPSAQTGIVSVSAEAEVEASHTFEVRDGQIYFDGQHLPNAIPAGIDLAGYSTDLTYSGPVSPLLEIDGVPYVFEDESLIPLGESSRAGNDVYILDESSDAGAMPREQMQPIVEAAYMRDVADADEPLYNQMRREANLEAEVLSLASSLRGVTDADERSRLTADLRRQLSDLLSLKHEIRSQEIDLASRRLDAARLGLEERRSLHEAIVDERLRELIGER